MWLLRQWRLLAVGLAIGIGLGITSAYYEFPGLKTLPTIRTAASRGLWVQHRSGKVSPAIAPH
jgi:hypothetical protein